MNHHPLPTTIATSLRTAPPLRRGSMTPRPWRGFWGGLAVALLAAVLGRATGRALDASWTGAARWRRRALLSLVFGSATAATVLLWQDGGPPAGWLPALQIGLFALLFAWVAAGCVTALMGYVSLLWGDRHALSARSLDGTAPLDAGARTALVMPICNEDIGTVFGGLRATLDSLHASGDAPLFDTFILSDTSDPALRAAELEAWQRLREALGPDGARLHYRLRTRRSKRKAGNVMDFCRRWGRDFRYMIVLDADSVMSGEALTGLVRLMEANPRAGIVQTAPRGGGLDTLHARAQAFAGSVTGRLFAAGLAYWQLGESHYWGHNAILRVEPFMRHCALAKLPGRGGLSGEILSHDFVEAALMRRAGYEVWLAGDLAGSYEQQPPHLIDELGRDRRWCQGNLQNARLIAEPGFAGVHRAMFISGALSYAAAPLWLGFVLLGLAAWFFAGDPTAPAGDRGLPLAAIALWATTLAMLLLPRVLGVALVLQRGEQAAYGGGLRLAASALLEALLSALQAPVRMLAHSAFVLAALTGLKLQWKSPSREAQDVGWRDASNRFGLSALLSAAAVAWLAAGAAPEALRLLPMLLPLLVAVPLAVLTSRARIGAAWRARGWLLTPEESERPALLRQAWGAVHAPEPSLRPVAARAPRSSAAVLLRRAVSVAVLAVSGMMIAAAPRPVEPGALSASDIAAQRIVQLASSPAAEPRVLGPARFNRVNATIGAEMPLRRRPTSI